MSNNDDNDYVLLPKRSEKLLAEFVPFEDSSPVLFAKGWKFAVHECFKTALDIKLTKKVQNNKIVDIWTQGNVYNFSKGDLIYDNFSVYWHKGKGEERLFTWDKASKDLNLSLQIIEAYPSTGRLFKVKKSNENHENDQNIISSSGHDGYVRFKILKKQADSSKLNFFAVHECTQVEFVRLLRDGTFTPLDEADEIKVISGGQENA